MIIVMLVSCFAGCEMLPADDSETNGDNSETNGDNSNNDSEGGEEELQFVDYAAQLKFDPNFSLWTTPHN